MIVIPAIDLKGGRCVRLSQGRMDRETVYSDDPVQMARYWEAKGAERLHVVDLDGAVGGRPVHQPLVREMVNALHIPMEVGGGIRNLETIERYLFLGVRWVILGTIALKNPGLVREACEKFPGRVILGIDAREGKVAFEGWREQASLKVIELARQFEGIGLSALIFTDIDRDGMSTGLNLEMIGAVARAISIPVIASGGVSRIEDLRELMALESAGVIGVIVGRALYTAQIDLEEAIRVTKRMTFPAELVSASQNSDPERTIP